MSSFLELHIKGGPHSAHNELQPARLLRLLPPRLRVRRGVQVHQRHRQGRHRLPGAPPFISVERASREGDGAGDVPAVDEDLPGFGGHLLQESRGEATLTVVWRI